MERKCESAYFHKINSKDSFQLNASGGADADIKNLTVAKTLTYRQQTAPM
jgi:hypothetical protein